MPLNPLGNLKRPPGRELLPANILLRQRETPRLSEKQEQIPVRAGPAPLAPPSTRI